MANQESGAWEMGVAILVVLGFLTLMISVAPGMVAVEIVAEVTKIKLDAGQMWTFSILTSVAFVAATTVVVRIARRDNEWLDAAGSAALGYACFALAVVVVGLVSYFGFHVAFFGRMMSRCFT